ncbi:hypothetical protein BEK98_29980 [Streptomyces diastatochromogenes]|uniref:Uncharacterized protein n=1 Tax=Streptomyces diastatochromogenes TaxID=42236 RepID=A0A233S763_STRDA|nr:hypothetical protein BEK98_29980 [Streptomyces diastatochromogenes]
MEKTADDVLSDLRFASVGVGEARVSAARSNRAAADGVSPCLDADFTVLKSGEWQVFMGSAPVPAKFRNQAGANRGVISLSVGGRCKRPS